MTPNERVEKYVCDGLVLDDFGQWVPIKQMVARERRFLAHLAHGEVIFGDQWLALEKVRARAAQQSDTSSATTPVAVSSPDIRFDLNAALSGDDETSAALSDNDAAVR